MRVPRSKKKDVEQFLKRFEVIEGGSLETRKKELSAEQKAYQKGYKEGFKQGEELQYLLTFAIAGTESDIQLARDVFRKRMPDSVASVAMEKLAAVIQNYKGDVSTKKFSLLKVLGG